MKKAFPEASGGSAKHCQRQRKAGTGVPDGDPEGALTRNISVAGGGGQKLDWREQVQEVAKEMQVSINNS